MAGEGDAHAHAHEAHHVEEFGDVKFVEKPEKHDNDDDDESFAIGSLLHLAPKHINRLRKRVWRRRHLQQHFMDDTLYRTAAKRSVSQDELFLDLIIVANLAAIGHELRDTFEGWVQLEKFFLLFGAVYSSWRALVMYWNLWGVTGDLFDKATVYITFTLLTVIGIFAHGAFTVARPYVAVAAFLATAIPYTVNAAFAFKEQLLNGQNNVINQPAFFSFFNILVTLPYFAAAFVTSARTARILFWIPPLAQMLMMVLTMDAYIYIHRNREGYSRMAVNIELMAEKYEVLTLIVLGESLVAILFEAAEFVLADSARIANTFLATIGATSLVYALQTLYCSVDSKIIKGGKHALRYNKYHGFAWGSLHLPYHICLVLMATGLGIMFRDIIVLPNAAGTASAKTAASAAVHVAVRATAPKEGSTGPAFNEAARWLFSAGWGGTMLCSALLALTHARAPRELTKFPRLAARTSLALGLGVLMPFTKLAAGHWLLVFSLVTALVALMEFILHQADSVDVIRRLQHGRGPNTGTPRTSLDDSLDTDHSSDDESHDKDGGPDVEALEERAERCNVTKALTRRMKQKGKHRLLPASELR